MAMTSLRKWTCIGVSGLIVLAAAGGSALAADDVTRIQEKAEELATKVRGVWYESVGMGGKPGLDRAHRDYAYLLGPAKLKNMADLVAAAPDPKEKEAREQLLRFLQMRTIWSQVAPTVDNYLGYAREASIQVPDGTLYYRRFWQQFSQTPDRNQRRVLYLAAGELVSNANVYLLNIEIDLHNATERLGLGNYYDFLAETEGWDRELMRELAVEVLEKTTGEYTAIAEKMCQGLLEQELRRARAYDVPILLAQHAFDGAFPSEKLEGLAGEALGNLGIKLEDQRYLRYDLKDREGKDPQCHTFPIDNGDNTRVTMISDGGLDDYRAFMRGLGQAQYYYGIDPGLPFEERFVGNPIVAMSFGELFVRLFEEPAWIERHVPEAAQTQADLSEALRFLRLYELREAAGRYLFQLKLQADSKTPASAYTEQIEQATLIPQTGNEEGFYLLANDRFASGGRLVAAVLEAHLRQKLIADFGPEWFLSKRVGTYLESIASEGFGRDWSDWAAEWGLAEMDAQLLLAELNGGAGSD